MSSAVTEKNQVDSRPVILGAWNKVIGLIACNRADLYYYGLADGIREHQVAKYSVDAMGSNDVDIIWWYERMLDNSFEWLFSRDKSRTAD